MEEIAEGVIRIVSRVLVGAVRLLIWLIWELMCETLLWYLGWPVVRALTLGRFPEQHITNGENEAPLIFILVVATGFAAFLLLVFLFVTYMAA